MYYYYYYESHIKLGGDTYVRMHSRLGCVFKVYNDEA